MRRMRTLYEKAFLTEKGNIAFQKSRRVLRRTAKHKNGKVFRREPSMILGITVPRNPAEAIAFDNKTGITYGKKV